MCKNTDDKGRRGRTNSRLCWPETVREGNTRTTRAHPSKHDRQLAGLRLAAVKWGGGPIEVVDLPPPGQAQVPEHKRPRTIEQLHEALRELAEIGRRIARKTDEMIEATGIDVRRRDRGHEGGSAPDGAMSNARGNARGSAKWNHVEEGTPREA